MTHRFGSLAGSSLAAFVAFALAPLAHAEISVLVGGRQATSNPNDLNNMLAGDQATLALAGDVQFEYEGKGPGVTGVLAYLDRHMFCANVQSAVGNLGFEPRYQASGAAADVWKFPDFKVGAFEYLPTGTGFAMRADQVQTPASPLTRCLTALPGDTAAAWNADRGLFGSGFGDYPGDTFDAGPGIRPPQDWPSGSHQNFKVVAKQFPGHASGREVSLVRVEVQKAVGAASLRSVDVMLVDAYNNSVLSGTVEWCLLDPLSGTDYDDNWVPPAGLCAAVPLFPNTGVQTSQFVRQGLGFTNGFHAPAHVLVSRSVRGTSSAGQPRQAFAALRLDLAVSFGVTEEMQDWYLDDSVWYTY